MTRIRYLLVLLLAWIAQGPAVRAQERASLYGFVTDATSGETLLLANVLLEGTSYGTATNNAGYYALPHLPSGRYTVRGTFVGYREVRVEVALAPGEALRLDLALIPDDYELDEVAVTAERESADEIRRLGMARLQAEVVRQIPAVLEPDVFRSLQLLPGIQAASDYSSGLYIRGGSPDQTLILLDRTTVYNPSHFFGFFSTFNPDAIKDVRLFKGGYLAAYGGRLGSVVDIYNKDGNRRETEGRVSVGLLASRALLEGPYAKGSWMLAARRSTLEPVLAALRAADVDGIPESYYFYDVNGKLNYDAPAGDRLSLAFYAGQDALDVEPFTDLEIDLVYGNRTVSGNWTHLFSQVLFSNLTLTASQYRSLPTFSISGSTFEQENRLYDVSAKADVEYVPNERHSVAAGFWGGHLTFRFRNVFDGRETLGAHERMFYGSAYLQDTYRPSPRWSVQAGLRASYFARGDYLRLEPRLSIEHQWRDAVRFQAGYGRYYQFLTLVTSELFSGFDTWLTTGTRVPPSFGDQYVAGVKAHVGRGVDVDAEAYFRTMHDLFEYDPFLPDVAGLDYADLFRYGDGYAYGGELLVRKATGRVDGFVGYTFGRTRRRFDGVNEGRYYAPKYDRTHDVNVVANYGLARAWRLTAVFSFSTGQAYTQPRSQYKLYDDPMEREVNEVLVTEYNNARLPPYHRLDLGFSRTGRFFGFARYELQVQVINAYSRRNVWFYLYDFEDDDTITRREIPQIPVPIPNLSFTLTF